MSLVRRTAPLRRRIRQRESGQLLAELIVHFARDPPPLVFLREDQPRQNLAARPFRLRAPPLRQIEMGADDSDDRSVGSRAEPDTRARGPDVVPVFVAQTEFPFVGLDRPRDALVHLPRAVHVFGVKQSLPRRTCGSISSSA